MRLWTYIVHREDMGTALLVQWLRLHAPRAGGQVRSLARELLIDLTGHNSDWVQPIQINIKNLKKARKKRLAKMRKMELMT